MLGDYQPRTGKWLEAGVYDVRVTSFTTGISERGTPFVQFVLEADDGRTINKRYWLSDKAVAAGFLTEFAIDCGLSSEQIGSYDVDIDNCHARFQNKRVCVTVNQVNKANPGEEPKYIHEVVRTKPISGPAPMMPQQVIQPEPMEPGVTISPF